MSIQPQSFRRCLQAAAFAAAVAPAQAAASPMPVRQIQFPSLRPSLPQQSRLIGCPPTTLSVHGFGAANALTPNPPQLWVAAQTLRHQLQPQVQSRRQHDSGPAEHDAAAVVVCADVPGPLLRLPEEAQALQAVSFPPAVVQMQALVPSAVSHQMAHAASSAVASVPAAKSPHQPPQQLPQQLPEQLPHQVPAMPQITWPQPVVSWPHQVDGCGETQAAVRQEQGMPPHAGVQLPPCSAPPSRSAALQGLSLGTNRGLGFPLLPAGSPPQHELNLTSTGPLQPPRPTTGSAPLGGATLGALGPPPTQAGSCPMQGINLGALGPSLTPPAGSASVQEGTLGALGPPLTHPAGGALMGAPTLVPDGSVPSGVAAPPSSCSWKGMQADVHATIQSSAVPPNKR